MLVQYTLTQTDADAINKHRENNPVTGNEAREGDEFPMLVVRMHSASLVNGQVFTDGNHTHWVTSVYRDTADRNGFGCWRELPTGVIKASKKS